ncbi:hypothetical protein SAMN02745127_02488 [Oceanospirillum multiglobuliferum]|uniref:Uncharacterized protein n=1 Tax=Oceanospirillum multiglobuliferum TaxID=64969 RepID=A0A1T4RNV8_9GAMM|nr:hypothetical protein [Oceanospirillum multiglobuliferum]OPX54657.1 hypothetical protein BTE48_12800 [Oceanospirillum multiglobuliferum]SKA17664.1 hypothetical protein SAMN02745127_02488 [Oceanospirillum multiglobuliferum]
MNKAHLAQLNLKFIEKSAWIVTVSFFALVTIVFAFKLSTTAIFLGAAAGFILGIISPFFWYKNYQILNTLAPSFLLIIPGGSLANSSDTINVSFQWRLQTLSATRY